LEKIFIFDLTANLFPWSGVPVMANPAPANAGEPGKSILPFKESKPASSASTQQKKNQKDRQWHAQEP
jgi:hypothetical protein